MKRIHFLLLGLLVSLTIAAVSPSLPPTRIIAGNSTVMVVTNGINNFTLTASGGVPTSGGSATNLTVYSSGTTNRPLRVFGTNGTSEFYVSVDGVVVAPVFSFGSGSITSGSLLMGGGSSGGRIYPTTSGLEFTDVNVTGAAFIQFGGETASFPALKRSGTELQVRLADDSGYGNLAANVIVGTNLHTHGSVGIGTTSPGTYNRLDVQGTDATGNGVAISLHNLDNSGSSFASYKMVVGSGGHGGIFFGSKAAIHAYGIVDGVSLRTSVGTQDIGFSTGPDVLTGTGMPSLIIKASGAVGIGVVSPLSKLHVVGDVRIASGNLVIPSGANSRAGNATLVGGTIAVAVNTVTANSVVMLTRKTSGGTIGTSITYTLNAGTGFTINSDNILDTSVFSYFVIENP